MKSEPISGPMTLELALQHAGNGRPEMLLMLVADAMGTDVAAALADLLLHPEKLAKPSRAKFSPREADEIRGLYKRKRKLSPKVPAPILQERYAESLGISVDLLRDILLQKNSYAEKPEAAEADEAEANKGEAEKG